MSQITAIAGVVDAELSAYHDEDGLVRLHAHVCTSAGGDEIEIVLDQEQTGKLAMALLFGADDAAADRLPCALGMRRMSGAGR